MEALAVDENGTASQRISCPKGYPVGIGIHIHPVADQFQAASEVGIARIGDIDQSRSIRSPDSDGARPIELGMQVDGSAGKSKGSAFTDADNSSIVRIYADSRTARESERTLFNSEEGQGIPCVSKGQRARSRFGQGSAGPHDIG
ncbi:unknown [Akkermansia muciniphila CAG:154]|nr:unknown [Akkermansia muciniphila CAG:154]